MKKINSKVVYIVVYIVLFALSLFPCLVFTFPLGILTSWYSDSDYSADGTTTGKYFLILNVLFEVACFVLSIIATKKKNNTIKIKKWIPFLLFATAIVFCPVFLEETWGGYTGGFMNMILYSTVGIKYWKPVFPMFYLLWSLFVL